MLVLPDGKETIGGFKIQKKSFYAAYEACGADFCSIKEIDDGILILFGDGAGHGVNESITAILCMTVFNSTITEDPSEMLRRINRILFATLNKAYVMCIRIRNNEIFYCGRIEQAILSNRHFDMNCAVLGASEEYEFEAKVAKFEDSDVLTLRTDGAVYKDPTDDQLEVIIRKEGTSLLAL